MEFNLLDVQVKCYIGQTKNTINVVWYCLDLFRLASRFNEELDKF